MKKLVLLAKSRPSSPLAVAKANTQRTSAALAEKSATHVAQQKQQRSYYVTEINARWNKSLDGIIGIGTLLLDAEKTLDKQEYIRLTRKDLPFTYSVLRKFMRLASCSRITDPANRSILPHSWNTLYEISQMAAASFEKAKALKIITPKCQWRVIKAHRDKFEPKHRKQVAPPIAIKGGICIQLSKQQILELQGREYAVKQAIATLLIRKFHFSHPKVELKAAA